MLITLAGAALRLYRLGAADLWLDEANTVFIASQPVGPMLHELASEDVHPPLFYLLVKLPLAISASEIGLRAVPWLFGVLCIPLTYLVARDFAGRAAGLVAATLVAVSAPLVVFSQEARMYTLLAWLELLATWSLLRGLEGGGRGWWALFAVASAAALYTHNLAGLFLVAHLAIGFWHISRIRSALAATLAALALYAPWLPFVLGQTLRVEASDGWLGPPPPLWIPAITAVNLLAGSEARDGLLSPRFALEHLYLLGGALALLVFGWHALHPRPVARRAILLTATVPIGLSLALSQVARIYVDKTFLVASLLLAVVMAAAVPAAGSWTQRIGPVVAVALLVCAELWAVTLNWQTQREDYRTLVRDLDAQVQPGDRVVAVPGFLARPVRYYLSQAGSTLAIYGTMSTSANVYQAPGPGRVWIVSGAAWDDIPASRAAARWREQAGYKTVTQHRYPDDGLRLTLYKRPG